MNNIGSIKRLCYVVGVEQVAFELWNEEMEIRHAGKKR